jgi:hypothetical protein
MRLKSNAAGSTASALASSRVALVFGGALLLSESVVLASSLFAAAGVSFIASVLIAAKLYGIRAPRPAEAGDGAAPRDAVRT